MNIEETIVGSVLSTDKKDDIGMESNGDLAIDSKGNTFFK